MDPEELSRLESIKSQREEGETDKAIGLDDMFHARSKDLRFARDKGIRKHDVLLKWMFP